MEDSCDNFGHFQIHYIFIIAIILLIIFLKSFHFKTSSAVTGFTKIHVNQ